MSGSRNRTPVMQDPLLSGPTTTTEQLGNGEASASAILPATGDINLDELRDMLNAPGSLDVRSEDFQNHAEALAFMEEEMLVRVEESTNPSDEPIVLVSVNGTPQHFIRGKWIKTKRKFVEALARAKPFNVMTPEVMDANGDRTTKIVTSSANRYPFSVNSDANPRGRTWLNAILNEV